MTDTNYSNQALNSEVPESVTRLVDAILEIDINLDMKKRVDSLQEIVDIVDYTVSELFNMSFVDNSRFIERAKIVSGLFSTGFHTVFEYDKWYINPIYLFENKSLQDSVFIKKGNTPALVTLNEPISYILAVSFGIHAEVNIGVDFTSKKWVNRFTKKESIHSLLIKFLMVDITDEDMQNLDKYDDFLLFDGPNDSSKNSLRTANFLIRSLTKIIMSSVVLDERVDAFTEIIVAGGLSESSVYEYWIEFGEFYLIASYHDEHDISVGLLSNFEHNKDICFSVLDVLNAYQLYKQNFTDELRKKMN